jgi:hypothetical protein
MGDARHPDLDAYRAKGKSSPGEAGIQEGMLSG